MKLLTPLLLLLAALPAHAATYVAGSDYDPRLRSAKYLIEDQRQLASLTELARIRSIDDWRSMPQSYQWALGKAYLGFGMRNDAGPIFRNLGANTNEQLELARLRLRLAELEFQRGYLNESRNTLYAMREKLPDSVVPDWQDLLSRVLLANGRYSETVEVLTELKNSDDQSNYTRYNLAIAYLKNGELQKGRDILDRIGRIRVTDNETLALRDKANTTLGWNFLKSQLGGTAKPIFFRVRSEGPFSNRALLGLGWSELSPRGERQRRELPPELSPYTSFSTLGVLLNPGFVERFDRFDYERKNPRFRLGKISTDEQVSLKRALVAWVELTGRDPMDPAVQEALLAIPYALDRLGAHTDALNYYEKAVKELEVNRKRISAAVASIGENRMIETIVKRDLDSESGWEWKLKDLPDAPETYYLQNLLSEHRFQEALKNYRDVRLLSRNMDAWQDRLTTLEIAYAGRPRGDELKPDEMVARAREGWTPPWQKMSVALRLEQGIGVPGAYDDPVERTAIPPMQMVLGNVPDRFDGPYERLQQQKARAAQLREQLALASNDQARILQAMATEELEGQRKAIEKYLVEARFSLARLYDRVLKEEAGNGAKPTTESSGSAFSKLFDYFGGGDDAAKKSEPAPKESKKK